MELPVLLELIAQLAEHDLDLDRLRSVAAVEVEIIGQGEPRRLWRQHAAQRFHHVRPARTGLSDQHRMLPRGYGK
jgi:hypothetical protein